MAELYVYCSNHMDLTWRRPRYKYGNYDGNIISSATDVQERQIEAGLDFIRLGGNYDLEQSISLREYLQNNPDTYEEIKQMMEDGKLHVLGGGESVIDYNFPHGETIVRNHMYSIRWLMSEFGVRPKFAACPDTFGLSGNLPALFKDLGYEGMGQYARVFGKAKPFWRGISGDIIPLATASFGSVKSCQFGGLVVHDPAGTTCDLCHGEGCAACGYSGEFGRYKPVSDFAVKYGLDCINAKRLPNGDFCLIICEEESTVSDRAMNVLKRIADELGMHLHPIGFDELSMIGHKELLERYHNGEISEEEIDERQEGNPVTTGCYTTRIKLKQKLRKCEAALTACERIAVAVQYKKGELYPVKTLEELWRKLEYLYFHDAAPASHSDDAYDELMEIAEVIFRKATHLINRYISILNKDKNTVDESGLSFVVYNPLEFDVENVRLEGRVEVDEFVSDGRIIDMDGNQTEILEIRHSKNTKYGDVATVEFFGSIPAFGYKVFKFIPSKDSIKSTATRIKDALIENEHLCVTFKDYQIDSVVDKHTGEVIAGNSTFSPIVTDDAGNPWGRTAMGCYLDNAIAPEFYLNINPPHIHEKKMEVQKWNGGQRVTVYVKYSRPDRNLEMLDWKVNYDLIDGSEELNVHITTYFDAKDLRLSTVIVLPSAPKDGMLEHEIPFGKIRRGKPTYYDVHGYADEWPALHYVCADLENVNVLVCNSGTPATKLAGSEIRIALMRTPTQKLYAFDTEGALDKSEHNFYFTLSASPDKNLTAYRRGTALNAFYPVVKGTMSVGHGKYMPIELPNNVPLLTCKGAEDGNGYIVRYVGMENSEVIKFQQPVQLSNVLEEDKNEEVTEMEMTPFAIRTFRII